MPISIALLLCIPLGFLFYFGARWGIRFVLGRFEQGERRAARLFGVFGASLIPLIWCTGLIEESFPGRLGTTIGIGFFAVATTGLLASILATLKERK
jgi:hypothetical protein